MKTIFQLLAAGTNFCPERGHYISIYEEGEDTEQDERDKGAEESEKDE